jgi:thioredoxin 1
MIITESNFKEEVETSTKPVVLDFHAPWCGPCNAMTPLVNKLAEEYKDRFVVGKVNVDEQPELAKKYNVSSIPHFAFIKDGEVKSTKIGVCNEAQIVAELEKLE